MTKASLAQAIDNFHTKHHDLYTFNMLWQGVELLTFRLRATIPKAPFELKQIQAGSADAALAKKAERRCWFHGIEVQTPVYDGEQLLAGNIIIGPAIIEEPTTTVVVPPSYTATVDEERSYHLAREPMDAGGRE